MARTLDPRWSFTVTQARYFDGVEVTYQKTIVFHGMAGDPDADNYFDRGPHNIQVQIPFDKVKTLEEIEAAALAAADAAVTPK